ncbi:MAG: RcnB family protein [Janthinobacterium lividum]
MKKIISSIAMTAALASSAVYAQQGPDQGPGGNGNHGGDRGGPGQGQMHGGPGQMRGDPEQMRGGPDHMHGGPGMRADRGGPGDGGWQGGPGGEWRHRGGRLPGDYRDRQYVVDDWRGYDLQPPPRGYHWVGVGGDYLLVAIASGVISQIITGR